MIDYRWGYLHTDNPACGQYAFYMKDKPLPGTRVSSEEVYLDDGSHPLFGSVITCQHCHEPLVKQGPFPLTLLGVLFGQVRECMQTKKVVMVKEHEND